ncbi:MAG: ABC transporter permease [Caldilineaceae bacterium]|nr:ABC transporter permease [Caldilineaceae bacterium]
MLLEMKSVVSARDLLLAWTGRNVRARYQQSALGWLWALIQPVASVLMFTLIFTRFVPVDTGGIPYIVFSYVAMVPWTFLAASLSDMSNSLVYNMGLVAKIYFPREILPIAAMLARLLDFFVASLVLIVLMVIYRVPLVWEALIWLPVILAVQIALILGLGIALASMNVFYRDVQPMLTLGIQLWFYASPIIYPVDLVPESMRTFYYLNPMAGILESYRAVLIHGSMPGSYLATSAFGSVLILVIGYWLFKRVEFLFADLV